MCVQRALHSDNNGELSTRVQRRFLIASDFNRNCREWRWDYSEITSDWGREYIRSCVGDQRGRMSVSSVSCTSYADHTFYACVVLRVGELCREF